MHDTLAQGPAEADWNRLAPVIEAAVDQLGESDRVAVLLRFVERRTFGEIGADLCLTEEAARKRVDRALEKLRRILGRRGVDSTATALAAALTTNAVTAAPAGLAATITGTAMAGAAAGGGLSFIALMSMTKFQVAGIGGLLLAGLLGVALQQQAHARLRDELVAVRQQAREASRLRAENARLAPAAAAPDPGSDELARLREEAGALKQQVAAASKITLAPGMVPSASWKEAGRATPGDALETLLWAAESGDIQAVGRMVGFDARTRLEADAIYPSMPEVLRKAGDITSVEEMVGLAWTMGAQLVGAEVIGLGPAENPADLRDDVTIRVRLQKTDGTVRLQELPFHRTPDGWQWVLSHRNLDFVGAGIGDYTKHILDKK